VDTDLLPQLQAALGASYRIVRELGGGGMSRVFLADDLSLNRSVVVKVLHPELAAGVNADRFNREVQLSARLQHPHIVPVLSAGDINGLPYYIMPFVKGKSLRARVAEGEMPIAEIVGILGDVAKALGYAHDDGVVHRDIKPDNILLSGGAATVADFGIAKALSSARAQNTTDGALTTLGTSLGTPAYMAPEQVAGDPDTDHRADIYSLGSVAYEMLCGKAPFAGKSPQQMLAAQVMEKPVPIAQRRPDVPAALAALVMRCLEKEPSRRPQTAAEVVTGLESTSSHDSLAARVEARRRRGPWIAAAVLTFIVVSVGIVLLLVTRTPPAPSGTINLAVAPFDVLDPQLALWKEGIVDVLARNLDGAGPLRALSPSVTIKKWDGRAERTSALAFGKRVGAQLVIYGQLQSSGHDFVDAKLWIVDVDRSSAPIEIDARDSLSRMDRVTDSLSIRALAAIGQLRTIGAAKLASLGSSSLPAIRAFLQGAQYFRRTQWDSAAASLQDAVAIDSTFGIAYAMLGEAYGWTGDSGSELIAPTYAKAGAQIRAGLSPHDSLTLVAVKHFGLAHGPRRGEELRLAYAAAKDVVTRYPDDAAAWYLYADMRFHNDRTLTEREALDNFDRAIHADSSFAPAYIHAIDLAYRNGPAMGRRYATAYLARTQSAHELASTRLAIDVADGKLVGKRLQAVLDTLSPEIGGAIFAEIRRLPDSAEVAVDLLRAGVRRPPPNATNNMKRLLADELGFRGHVDEGWRIAIDALSYTAAEMVALGLVPADSAERLMVPWIKREDDYSFSALTAIGMAKDTTMLATLIAKAEQRSRTDTSARKRVALTYFAASARGYLALAKHDSTAAEKIFDALPDSAVDLPVDQFIRARLVGRHDPKRALMLLERASTTNDVLYVARQLERGRIAERLGDKERAVDAFGYVAAAWRNSESAPLRDAAKEARAALSRLDGDGRMRAALTAPRAL
jgi:serine/threonine-protein kinase